MHHNRLIVDTGGQREIERCRYLSVRGRLVEHLEAITELADLVINKLLELLKLEGKRLSPVHRSRLFHAWWPSLLNALQESAQLEKL